jgi:hypothetical protein
MSKICVIPGGEPFFKTKAAYEMFREDFRKAVDPELRKQRIARQKSEVWAMTHFVD